MLRGEQAFMGLGDNLVLSAELDEVWGHLTRVLCSDERHGGHVEMQGTTSREG